MMFLGVAVYWVESLFYSLEGHAAARAAARCVAAPLPALFPASCSTGAQAAAAEFKLHLALAMIAYGLFVIALLHAALMSFAERQLHLKGRVAFRTCRRCSRSRRCSSA